MDQELVYYFAYGSNMNPERLAKREISVLHTEAGTHLLNGYQLAFNKRSSNGSGSYANIVASANGVVEGMLYRLQNFAALEKLDRFEGYPSHYNRFQMPVINRDGAAITSWVYIATPKYIDDHLMPEPHYVEHLLKVSHILSPGYVAMIKRLAGYEQE